MLCPVCGKPYEYCHGDVKTPYFRHKDKTKCEYLYSEPETEEHIKGKQDLYEWIKKQLGVTNVVLEAWLPETKQRPDIMFDFNGKKCVIEYQCSPISSEYYERHNLYKAAGIYDVWICGVQKYIQYYHKGHGDKGVNTLEDVSRMYYNPQTKHLYHIENIDSAKFKRILRYKKYNVMRNPFDYRVLKENYILVKDQSKSFTSYTYYPSGKPSNKYPYPLRGYNFNYNASLGRCYILENLQLNNIN